MDQVSPLFQQAQKTKEQLLKNRQTIDFDDQSTSSSSKGRKSRNLEEMEVTPYSICNLTEGTVIVSKIVDQDFAKQLEKARNQREKRGLDSILE